MAALRPAIKLILAEALGLGVALTTFVPAGTTQQNIPMPGQPTAQVPTTQQNIPMPGQPTAQVPTGAQNIPMPGQPTAQVPTGAQNIPMPGQPTAQVPNGAATQQSVDELKVLVLNFQQEKRRVGDKLDK